MMRVSRRPTRISQIADNTARTHRELPPQKNQIAIDDIDDCQVASPRGLQPECACVALRFATTTSQNGRRFV